MKFKHHPIYSGAILLTLSGLLCRCIGFYYKIFLSRVIGPKELGLYQLAMPLLGIGVAFANSGIHTAISKYVAGVGSKNTHDAKKILWSGLRISLFLGFLFCAPCCYFSTFLATCFFHEPDIAPLLCILSLCIPLECFHGCINGYYFGKQKASIPSGGQCMEQLTRVASVFLLYYLCLQLQLPFTKTHAMIGLLLGEIGATLYYILLLSREKNNFSSAPIQIIATKTILKTAYPIHCTRLLLTFLSSFENIMIPLRLNLFGMTNTQALSIYGIYSGMALPMVFFPTVVSNSIAVMLLPNIAKAKEDHRNHYIFHTIHIGFFLSMGLGFVFSFFFYFFGPWIGVSIFHNEVAGVYIKTLGWLCPFLFLGVTMNSILNGLGNTKDTFFISTTGACIRLIFIFYAIPLVGFRGFLLGILVSQIFSSFLAYLRLCSFFHKKSQT